MTFHPPVVKTANMQRIEQKYDEQIDSLIRRLWKEHDGNIYKIAGELNITDNTARKWVSMMGVG